MTVSELKIDVFGIMQVFNRHTPAEELLRCYGEACNQNGSESQQKLTQDTLTEEKNC